MKLVRLGKPAKWASVDLQEGHAYLFENQAVPAVARSVNGDVEVESVSPWWQIKKLLAEPEKSWRLLVIRAGGAGDVLFSTPTLRELKKLLPNASIGYATSSRHPWLLDGNPNVSEVLAYPVALEEVAKWDHILNLEGVIEGSSDTHAVDLIARAAGLNLEDHSLDYSIPPERMTLAEKAIPREGKLLSLIHI